LRKRYKLKLSPNNRALFFIFLKFDIAVINDKMLKIQKVKKGGDDVGNHGMCNYKNLSSG
jgi:hypothetical protein